MFSLVPVQSGHRKQTSSDKVQDEEVKAEMNKALGSTFDVVSRVRQVGYGA